MRHDRASAMAADLAAADAAVAKWFGIRGVEMPAGALGAADASVVVGLGTLFHRRLLRCSSAKLMRPRLAAGPTSAPSSVAPWIEAATAAPTRQSNQ